jgi:YaiO family outer membrane protein
MMMKILALGLALLLSTGSRSFAQEIDNALTQNHLELEYGHYSLTSGYSDWNEINLYNYFAVGKKPDQNATEEQKPQDQMVIETDYQNHFDQGAGVLGATYTHNYDLNWYQELSGEYSTNNSILPGWLIFSVIHRKLLADRRLIVGVGAGFNQSEDPYSDVMGLVNLNYYFTDNISAEIGYRVNKSNPGSVYSQRGYGVVSYNFAKKMEAFLRYETGGEGYTVIGAGNFRNQFTSTEEAAQLLYWWNRKWGAGVSADFYQSQYYNRTGGSLILLMNY